MIVRFDARPIGNKVKFKTYKRLEIFNHKTVLNEYVC